MQINKNRGNRGEGRQGRKGRKEERNDERDEVIEDWLGRNDSGGSKKGDEGE